MYFTYALQYLKDQKLILATPGTLKKRLAAHVMGKVQATRWRLPISPIYNEAYFDKQDAKGREKFLNGGSGHKYLEKQLKHFLDAHS